MKVVTDSPPNIGLIRLALNPPPHAIFCYGHTIFNPTGKDIDKDIEYHESIHARQQGNNPDNWWNRYLTDQDFRQKAEIEAYSAQYHFNKQLYDQDKLPSKLLYWRLDKMAEALSSDYKLDLNFNQAKSKIRNYKI